MMSPVMAREPRSRCDVAPESYTDSLQPAARGVLIVAIGRDGRPDAAGEGLLLDDVNFYVDDA
jgi:hypothetical protein